MIALATPACVGVSDVAQLTEREREILAELSRAALLPKKKLRDRGMANGSCSMPLNIVNNRDMRGLW